MTGLEQPPLLLQQAIHRAAPERFHQSLRQNSPAMQQALRQILSCPYGGLLRRMYLESKVLELLVLQIAAWTECSSQIDHPTLRSQDIELIHEAAAILLQNWMDPPSLMELARQVGINDFKLKQGFRHVFGTTVFGYLLTYRMEQAKQLLLNSRLSVAEIARRVGYISPSAFSAAFRRHTGIPPKAFQQQG